MLLFPDCSKFIEKARQKRTKIVIECIKSTAEVRVMLVSDIMSTCVPECTEDMGVEEVFELIQRCDHGLVVVVDSLAHRVPIGVVTEHSICEQIIARGRNPKGLSAGSVIDSRIRKVRNSDLVEKIGDTSGVAAIIVEEDNRRICGLISKETMKSLPATAITSFAAVPGVANSVTPSKISEIPAFGWIQ